METRNECSRRGNSRLQSPPKQGYAGPCENQQEVHEWGVGMKAEVMGPRTQDLVSHCEYRKLYGEWMGKGDKCKSREASLEAIVIIQALMMVARTRMVAVEVMRSSWSLDISSWLYLEWWEKERNWGWLWGFWPEQQEGCKGLFNKAGKMWEELVWQGSLGCLHMLSSRCLWNVEVTIWRKQVDLWACSAGKFRAGGQAMGGKKARTPTAWIPIPALLCEYRQGFLSPHPHPWSEGDVVTISGQLGWFKKTTYAEHNTVHGRSIGNRGVLSNPLLGCQTLCGAHDPYR